MRRILVSLAISFSFLLAPSAAYAHDDTTTEFSSYTVVKGDTLSEIGSALGVEWEDIAEANNISDPYLIYPKQILKIPGHVEGVVDLSQIGPVNAKAADKYHLGAVQPHVRLAAAEIGPRFGVKTIYGWASGEYDHPKGKALDLMTNARTAEGKKRGDAIVEYAMANRKRLKITYIIWDKRIWSEARPFWHDYVGDSTHEDHVHISFE